MAAKSKKFRKLRLISLIEAIIIMILCVALIWAVLIRGRGEEQTVPVSAELSSAAGNNEDEDPEVRTRAVIDKEETFYQLDGKKILLSDSTYGQIFLPVYENVPACSLDMNSIVTRNGYSFYKPDGMITSIPGIDVSVHQGAIDWQQVRDAGVEFVIIRVGYRTYGGGEIKLDEGFVENISGATAAGLKVGVYFFSQAVTVDEAVAEADAVLDAIAPYNITYPVVYDWELIYDDTARTDDIPVDVLTDSCIAFCERVKSAGYTPMIYQNKGTTLFKLDLPRLQDYDFWLAEYGSEPTYYYDYQMWQYSCTGRIPGIAGEVDLNISFKDYSEE
ncbi:MAG: glycoside hydrolase family 25 protein [Oscillospiraceae bacterium]|nr:glycoside hydrolase family 25 protein [Oscillospiraceae bacterium]